MADNVLPLIAAAIGPLAGGGAVYVLGWRASRGRVGTSNAEVVWEAAESVRHDLADAYKTQRLELLDVKAELAAVKTELGELKTELAGCNRQLTDIRGHLEG